jgi:ferredoxin
MTVAITIDEKACVGCSLCAEVCPTNVFEFDAARDIPVVKKPVECFGCLSCSEICPATAVHHEGITKSASFYHNSDALALARKLGQPVDAINVPMDDKEEMALAETDLGVRLLSVAAVLKQTLGDSVSAIGTQAGRSLAVQLPRYQEPASLEESLLLTKQLFAPAWDLEFVLRDKALSLTVRTCFIRELCQQKSIALGGDLCTLFYGYIAGYLSKVARVRPRLVSSKPDAAACAYEMQLYPASA